jgi:hypothetical protein
LGCFFGTLPAAGTAAVVVAGSIASAAGIQNFGRGFLSEKGVACVALAGGTANMNSQTQEDVRVVQLMQTCSKFVPWMYRSVRVGRMSRTVWGCATDAHVRSNRFKHHQIVCV